MPKIGRPTKLTPSVQKAVVDALSAGNFLEAAAGYAGISKDTLYRWLREGARVRQDLDAKELPDSACGEEFRDVVEFSDAVTRAMAEWEVGVVAKITSSEDWRAAAFLLERRRAGRWRLQQEVSHTGDLKIEGGESLGLESIKRVFTSAAGRAALDAIAASLEGESGGHGDPFEWGDVAEGEAPKPPVDGAPRDVLDP